MSWTFMPAKKSFEDFRAEWDELNRSVHNHLLLDSAFVSPLVAEFGTADLVLALCRDSGNRAMALLTKRGRGVWETFQPSQAPLGLILLSGRDECGERMRDLVSALPGYAFQLGVLQQDPDYSAFPHVTPRPDVEILEYISTGRVTLQGTFEQYWQGRGSNLRHNLGRQRRRLADQKRKLELVVCRDVASMADCVRQYGEIETLGWKGKEGTAIAADNAQGRVYRRILEDFGARGEALVFQLVLDGKVAASQFCLAQRSMLVALKTTYDETLEKLSPGLLVQEEILRYLWENRAVRVVEFYGRMLDWHRRWTDQVRTMYHVNCFRSAWVVRARRLLKRFR